MNVGLVPRSTAKSKLVKEKVVTVPAILLRYCLVDFYNVDTLETEWFYVEGAQVNRVKLNVICWLLKTRMESLGHLSTWRS